MHQPQKTQEDYIKGLVETRKTCDIYSQSLTANSPTTQVTTRLENGKHKMPTMADKLAALVGIEIP